MRSGVVLDLADCTEFRQALQARPPRVVHGALALLVALLGAALSWAAATRADLVVRAPGRVRPVTTPVKVFYAARSEVLSASSGGRVIEANVRQGGVVRRGDVLVRLETERLDNEIAKQVRAIRAGEEELAGLAQLGASLARQSEAARAKAAAELDQAREAVRLAKERQRTEVRLAEVATRTARDEESRFRKLQLRGATAPSDLIKAVAAADEAEGKLEKARLPVEEATVKIMEESLALADRDSTVQRQEQELKRAAKRAEVDAARTELDNRELERKQAVIRAPLDGVVIAGDVKVGDVLEAGKPVAEIARQGGFRFEAVVPSEEVGHLRLGMPVRIKLDAYNYQRYGTLAGTVCFLAPDSGVSEEKRGTTYVVKVAVEGDEVGRGAFRGRVKLGMAGQAEIVTGRESLLSLLVKQIRQSISLG